MSKQIQLENSWLHALENEFEKPYFQKIRAFLKTEMAAGRTIYPEPKNIFNALNLCPLTQTKVVIIGQDPYHGPQQAHGLSFSVKAGVPHPPSLVNIFKELQKDIGCNYPPSGDLAPWAKQGVLLLNAMLTVQANQAGSHAHIGWEQFTNKIIQTVSSQNQHVVFMLWGGFAK